jgi:hypothetical protein
VRVFSDESKLETLKISTFLHYTTRNVKMWQVLELANTEDDILSLVSILSLFEHYKLLARLECHHIVPFDNSFRCLKFCDQQ